MAEGGTGDRGSGGRVVVAILAGEEELDAAARGGLEELDQEIRVYEDPGEALEAIREAGPDLVIVDAAVPGADPAAFREALSERAVSPEDQLLVVLAPGRTGPPPVPAGIRHYLSRPFPPDALRAYAASLLGASTAGVERAARGSGVRPRLPSNAAVQRLYGEAGRWVGAMLDRARAGEELEISRCRPIAEEILTDLLRSNALVLKSLEPHGSYDLPSHCVNVAIMAGKIANGLAYDLERTLEVVQAGLLHDIGMAKIPGQLLVKKGPLTEVELAKIRRHPEYGAEMIAALGPRYEWMARAVRQEHERLNGQGYPQGLSGDEIDPIARILAVADVFEALSHPRAYRSPFTAFDALQKVVGMQREYFARDVVSALVNEISSFPLDSFVQLNTGEIGRVVATNPDNLLRPKVLILWDAAWKPLPEPRGLDLALDPGISITRTLHEAELPIT